LRNACSFEERGGLSRICGKQQSSSSVAPALLAGSSRQEHSSTGHQLMDLGLRGRTVIITGPAKGMGSAITPAFAAEGCNLALAGRDIAAIEPVASKTRTSDVKAIVVKCDVTDARQCEQLVEQGQPNFRRVDLLANIARRPGPIAQAHWA